MSGPAAKSFAVRFAVPIAIGAATLPALKIAVDFGTGGLGANPVEEILNRLGFWTFSLLVATLACTPIKDLAGWNWPLRIRRALGDASFVWATMHLAFYVAIDQGFDWGVLFADVVKRPFITIGVAAWAGLLPLAITSTSGMVKRLGFRRWKLLHRLVYFIALAALVHFVWRDKVVTWRQWTFGVLVVGLLAARAVTWIRTRRSA